MGEHKRMVMTLKDGTLWTQIFDYKGEVVSSYISDDEYEACYKARNFYKIHPEYLVNNPKRKW